MQNWMRPIFAFSTLFGPPTPEDFWLNTRPSINSVSSIVPLKKHTLIKDHGRILQRQTNQKQDTNVCYASHIMSNMLHNSVFQIGIKLYRTVGLNLVKSIGHFGLSSQKV